MYAKPSSIVALLLGVVALVVGSLLTLLVTTLTEPAAIATVAVVMISVLGAIGLGMSARRRPKTPYW